MTFERNRINKHEDQIESDVTDRVRDHVCEHYKITEIEELTPSQFQEIVAFAAELNEYSPMQIGFRNLINSIDEMMEENQ